jgi:hypothetical protein
MGMSIFDRIQSKLEILRLEKRYTRSRHRRSAFVSNAVYIDGEYVYQTPNSTGGSSNSSSASSTTTHGIDALHAERHNPAAMVPSLPEEEEYNHRQDESGSKRRQQQQQQQPEPAPVTAAERKRLNRHSSMPGFGGAFEIKTPRVIERRLSMIR